ncbi:MarR family winged helix-turn-helix transcriptional regulator [Pseudodonghicola flavimaris]|uniref:MarR family winged helix-turn-helix transcriptional regulator n=1 Tax=Pseudodonghicola flavimaris TaxID=3050036 RepID=A0ABT7F8A0_9RHOB|nr:MarR family winged helix-turn-helix transcriptional regulator [Pseudodonghicola flavimaris]MDK3020826.1 MarR family winged helix-turn-helix transcriptional regulator [Pseudodonghicola flavimaris]
MSQTLPEFDLDGYVPFRFAVVAHQLSRDLAIRYKDRFGISITEWRVLVNIGYSGDVSIRDIERRVSLEKSKVSRAASRLEAAGYLSKCVDESDRRLIKLALTEKGTTLLAEIVPIAQAYQAEVEALLGDKFEMLQELLGTLMDRAR